MCKNFKRKISFFTLLLFVLTLIPSKLAFATDSPPGTLRIAHNQWDSETDGDYDITLNIDFGAAADGYRLYEKYGIKGEYKLIAEGKFSSSQTGVQEATIPIRNRVNTGIYTYYAEAYNSAGVTKSPEKSATVGTEKGYILIDGVDDYSIEFQTTISQGTSTYKLTNRTNSSPNFSVVSSNTTVVKASVNGNTLTLEGISDGRSGLLIVDETTGQYRQIGVRVKKKDGTLPGMPNYLSLGQVSEDTPNDLEFWRDISYTDTNKRVDIRYIYLNDGPLEEGWYNWDQGDGQRAKRYINESLKLGMIPFFVFYNIPDKIESYDQDLKHINDKSYMEAYYKNLKLLIDICNEYAPDEPIGFIFEPDFLGYMLQQSKKRPSEITAVADAVFTSGILDKADSPKFENNLTGLVESINYVVSKYRKNAYFGWQFNTWAYDSPEIPTQGLMHKTEFSGWDAGRQFIKNVAFDVADYYLEAGVASYGANFISIDKYGLDGAYETGAATDPQSSKWFWNADLWNNYVLYTKSLHERTKLPILLWQIPVGHINNSESENPYSSDGKFPNLTNTPTNYEDSASTYIFGDTFDAGSSERSKYFSSNLANDSKIKANGSKITWESHIEDFRDAGVISILSGAGVGGSTDAVGNGKDSITDNFWWITQAQRYYKNPVPLTTTDIPSDKLPLAPSLSSDSIQNQGTYTLTATIPNNSRATSYKLYENGAVIKSGTISSTDNTITHSIVYKQTGTYLYSLDLINEYGSTPSNNVTIYVNNTTVPDVPVPNKGTISVDNVNNSGDYNITLSIPANSNATSYKLYENDKIIKTDSVTTSADTIVIPFKNKEKGTYVYRLDLINKDGTTPSNSITVTCNPNGTVTPSKAVDIEFSVSSDWGSGANIAITITNNSNEDLVDWNLSFDFDRVLTFYDADMKVSNKTYTLTPKPWNNTIKKGDKLVLTGGCTGSVANCDIYNVKFSPMPENTPTIAEDINNDGVVDLKDLTLISSAYNLTTSSSNFNSNYDLNKDNIIDIYDIVLIAKKIN